MPQMLAWLSLGLAALKGLLCIAYAFAHRRYQPRHAGTLYLSALLDVAVASLLFSLSGPCQAVRAPWTKSRRLCSPPWRR